MDDGTPFVFFYVREETAAAAHKIGFRFIHLSTRLATCHPPTHPSINQVLVIVCIYIDYKIAGMGAGGSVIANKCSKKRKNDKKLQKDYIVGEFIAEGVSGKVYFGKNKETNSDVALKFFGYRKNYDAKFEDIWREIDAMQAVRGVEGLVQVQGYFLDTKKGILLDKIDPQPFPVIVMELLEGGPLFGRINYRDSISEMFIAHIFRKMIRK